ncbi:MAG: hypothetical protein JNL05_08775 [Flavobacteriales bacterium]|nr:hypothetical protein [Flavobacteriales bacterium]
MLDSTSGQATHLSLFDADTLRQTARWARFLAITGFVMIGIMVVFGVFMGSMFARLGEMQNEMTGMPQPIGLEAMGTLYTVMFLLIGALYFVPTLLLFQFASRTLRALGPTFDPLTFSNGLQAHRRLYKFMGILMIIMLCLYGVGFLVMLLVGGMAAML